MEKTIVMILCLAMTVLFSGCSESEDLSSRAGKKAPGVEDVLEAEMAKADAQANGEIKDDEEGEKAAGGQFRQSGVTEGAPEPEDTVDTQALLSQTEGIDVDLTALSSTMVYSEVYNMMIAPENYLGKKIKMEGLFSFYHDENTGKDYYACIIQDATACCAQGIEFEPTDDYSYPSDFPGDGQKVTVEGVFDIYEEAGQKYCTLRDAQLM